MSRRSSNIAPPDPRAKPLEPGDHLTRDEFERRYEASPWLKKAELIEGVVFMAPPAVRWEHHATPHVCLVTWLGVYQSATAGVRAGDNASIRLDLDNEPQPDATMILEPALAGQAQLSADDYIEGAPELVAEVAASSTSMDSNSKLEVYRRNGVREYLVWRVLESAIDWFILRSGKYEPLAPIDGVLQSQVFPGLWLDPAAMVLRDLARVLEILKRGLGSPSHGEFVARLRSLGATPPNS